MSRQLEALILSKRIVVCLGAGGVGKTTVAASLALVGAKLGRRTLVITIDPARRLADALGVRDLGNEPAALSREVLDTLDVPPQGEIFAMMLDMKRTFDDLVERFAESTEARERILGNRIYQHVSEALAGSAEYSAMEKVYEVMESQKFDLVIVDTPPSQHALDFLEAPQRLLEFLDSPVVTLLVHPAFSAGRFGLRLFQRGIQRVLQVIERVSGMGFLEEISNFLLEFEGMSEGFRNRARKVRELLVGPDAAFFVVTGPARLTSDPASGFLERLREAELPLAGILANRVRAWPGGGPCPAEVPEARHGDAARSALTHALRATHGDTFPADRACEAAIRAASHYASLVNEDQIAIASLREEAQRQGLLWHAIPELSTDVCDVDGLREVAVQLMKDPRDPESAK